MADLVNELNILFQLPVVNIIGVLILAMLGIAYIIRDDIYGVILGKMTAANKVKTVMDKIITPKTSSSGQDLVKDPDPDPKSESESGTQTAITTNKQSQSRQDKYGYARYLNSDIPIINSQYSNKNNVSELECSKFCNNIPTCKFYNYNPINKTCKLKKLDSDIGIDTGLKRSNGSYNLYPNESLKGYILPGMPIHLEKHADCSKLCKSNSNCHWYSYDQQNKCYLNKAQYVKGMIHAQK